MENKWSNKYYAISCRCLCVCGFACECIGIRHWYCSRSTYFALDMCGCVYWWKMGEDGKTFLDNFSIHGKCWEWLALCAWSSHQSLSFQFRMKIKQMYAILNSYVSFAFGAMNIFFLPLYIESRLNTKFACQQIHQNLFTAIFKMTNAWTSIISWINKKKLCATLFHWPAIKSKRGMD